MLFQTPILLLIFNRPDKTKQVLDVLRKIRPAKLYVAADGPRDNHPDDVDKCMKAREVVEADWDCEVTVLFRGRNLGCREAVSTAISWFFNQVDEGIILEDDCVPSESFFGFCRELLERYRDDTRVMAISGDNHQDGRHVTDCSYYFSRYPHCWGWATWRRAWEKYDAEMSCWPECHAEKLLYDLSDNDHLFVNYWENIFNKVHAAEIDSWAYVWTFSCWASMGLTALPVKNLVKNIGHDVDATHTVNINEKFEAMQAEELSWPLVHPDRVVRHVAADFYTDMHVFGIGPERSVALIHRVISKVMTPLRCFLARFGVEI